MSKKEKASFSKVISRVISGLVIGFLHATFYLTNPELFSGVKYYFMVWSLLAVLIGFLLGAYEFLKLTRSKK